MTLKRQDVKQAGIGRVTRRERMKFESRRKAISDDDLLPEYDFTGAVRGKYYERYQEGTNVVLLDPGAETPEPRPDKALHQTRQKKARR